jgi:ligand-binding sensor domain-containing protein
MTNIILLLSILTLFTSCNGQEHRAAESTTQQSKAFGTVVTDLGKNIDCIIEDKNGHFWFASNGDGVYRYDGKTLLHLTDKDGLISNSVWKIHEDVNGYLWFSTPAGVCRYDGHTIENYTDTINNAATGLVHIKKGGLFFGLKNDVCYYDGASFTKLSIYPETYKPMPHNANRPYSIYSYIIDNAGNAWFGTQEKGVCRYDGKTFSYITGKDLDGPAVRAIYQDRSGIMWFGNNGGGLFRYDGKILRNITEEKGLGNEEFLRGKLPVSKPGSLARVWAITEDNDGNLWVGTIDAGVWKYDSKEWTNYTTKDGLAGDSIWAIYKDKRGEFWFVTNGDAICKFNGKTFTKLSFN